MRSNLSSHSAFNQREDSSEQHLIVTARQTLTTRVFGQPPATPAQSPSKPPLDLAAAAAREKGSERLAKPPTVEHSVFSSQLAF